MRTIYQKRMHIAVGCVFLLLVVLFGYILIDHRPGPSMPEIDPIAFIGEYSLDGGSWLPLVAGDAPAETGQTLRLRGHFEQEIQQNQTLWLCVENIGITMRLNGEQIFICNQPGSFPTMFHAPGYDWQYLSSPRIMADDNIELDIIDYYGNNAGVIALLEGLFVGDSGGLYRMMEEKIGLTTVIVLLTMIAGLIYLLEGLIYQAQRVPGASRVTLSGFYCLSGGLWCITDAFYPYFSLFISPPWLASVVDMSGIMLFPISVVLLVRFFMRGKVTRRMMDMVVLLAALAVSLCITFQIIGFADLHQQQAWIGSVAFALLTITLCCVGGDLKQYKDTYLLLLFLAIVPTVASMLIDGANLFFSFMPRRTLMRYSFSLSALLMISQLVAYAKQENETRLRMERMQAELAESRIAIMLSQIQPHFLYNALSTIMSLCYTDGKLAGNALASFAKYLRGNLDSISNRACIPFEQELAHLESYLVIEQIRFSDIRVIYDLQVKSFLLPPLTLQPLVENAIHHGVMERENGGTVCVSTRKTEAAWVVEIQDDGVGFDTSVQPIDEYSHIGISNTRERLGALCNGTLEVDSVIGSGTTVTVTIPK